MKTNEKIIMEEYFHFPKSMIINQENRWINKQKRKLLTKILLTKRFLNSIDSHYFLLFFLALLAINYLLDLVQAQ